MQKLKILNTREKRNILDSLKQIYDFNDKLDGVLFLSSKQKLFLLTGGFDVIEKGEERQLRIDKAGLYIGKVMPDGIRLSVEGSQLIGPSAKKNILEISDEQVEPWVKGEDLELNESQQGGYYLVKHKKDFLGCTRIVRGTAQNLISKNRRIKTLNI
ncbi:hypothetical protein AYK26_04660 [Euryarchaeota archaeon SM23-78]|nr:MAG: hypothetical protein AYK26_04660 [Euryarchaeota archaeon SM23-78]MBW3000788.1 hypothetical protein [Candidatus Woesearchaeota archaeon]